MIPLSIIDNGNVYEGRNHTQALQEVIELAESADKLGYARYWMAEHHNVFSTACTASAIVINQIANATARINVGFGGLLTQNHTPLDIAEQLGTLDSFFPGRIDLGLGRTTGSDPYAAHHLRRGVRPNDDDFRSDVSQILGLLGLQENPLSINAYPPFRSRSSVWILGSGSYGARFAAQWGLPYAFAGHFAAGRAKSAIKLYKDNFQPSHLLDKPHAMVTANVIAADTQAEAELLATSQALYYSRFAQGIVKPVPRPIEGYEPEFDGGTLEGRIISSPEDLGWKISSFIQRVNADELMILPMLHDLDARKHSISLTMKAHTEYQQFHALTSSLLP